MVSAARSNQRYIAKDSETNVQQDHARKLWRANNDDLEDWHIKEDHDYSGRSIFEGMGFSYKGLLLPFQKAKLCSASIWDFVVACEKPLRLSYGVFVARSYPTVTLSLALKETGVISIFSILNQDRKSVV